MAGFLPLILIFGLMYVLMIRPQQKKAKAQQALVAAISAAEIYETPFSPIWPA